MSTVNGVRCPFPDWTCVKTIGRGGYGEVYLVQRDLGGERVHAAMKRICIPESEDAAQRRIESGEISREKLAAHYRNTVNSMQDEIKLMDRLKGNSHIVSYQDWRIIEHSSGLGADIYILMEYLTPLNDWLDAQECVSYATIAKIGAEICMALTTCAMHNIVHRDIKPENVLVNRIGDFKLGDFGIAKKMDTHSQGKNKKIGTKSYLAPEVYNGGQADARSDIYSVGIIMYRLMNDLRVPFEQDGVLYDEALNKRFAGAKLTPPEHLCEPLWRVISRACAAAPEDRFESAEAMTGALNDIPTTALEGRLIVSKNALDSQAVHKNADHGDAATPRSGNTDGSIVRATGEKTPVQWKSPSGTGSISGSGNSYSGGANSYPATPAKPAVTKTPDESDAPATVKGAKSAAKPRMIIAIALGAALVLAAAIWLPGLLSSKNGLQPRVKEVQGDMLSFEWDERNPPYAYELLYHDEILQNGSSDVPFAAFKDLLPGTQYEFRLTDRRGAEGVLKQRTAESAYYDSKDFDLRSVKIYVCDRKRLADSNIETMIEKNYAKRVDGIMEMRDLSIEAQSEQWFAVAITSPGVSGKSESSVRMILRLSDGRSVTDEAKLTGLDNSMWQHCISLDNILRKAYNLNNAWLEGATTLEMYAGNDFAGDVLFEIKLRGRQDEQ